MTDSNKNDDFIQWLKDLESGKTQSRENENAQDNDYTNKINEDLNDKIIDEDQAYESYNYNDQIYNTSKSDNENSDYQNINYKNNNNDRLRKEYVDKDYVDQQIKKNKSKLGFMKSTALVLVGAVLGSFMGTYANNIINGDEYISSDLNSNQAISINAKEETNVENAVAKKSIKSVVGIQSTLKGTKNPFFYMGDTVGIGSGVIVSEDGYILTNAHVVQKEGSELQVIFADTSTADASLVYYDDSLDLAVIKVEKKGLPAISFADSDDIEIGDKAIAIGNPTGFNLQSTLTSGYISGLNRTITMETGQDMTGLIQTDASINSGNSGGALLNKNGDLIGINTAKAGNTDGIGFAIPSNTARQIVDQIISEGSYTPIVLGIRGKDISIYKQLYQNPDLGVDEGVIVSNVEPNSSADKAGIQPNDIIVKIGDKLIGSMNELKQTLITYNIGDESTITVYRNGQEQELNITFESERPNI